MTGPPLGVRWAEVTDQGPKPFVHPLVTPSGATLSVVSPSDHVWHRALWFAIKFVDGVNFWEEVEPFGTQRVVAPGQLHWVRPDGVVALIEERSLVPVQPPADADPDRFAIDWTTTLTAPDGAVLDRTPYTTWGGYGGLAFRGTREWRHTRILLADGVTYERPEGVPARWCDLSNDDAGITFLDHPHNPRHPVPWYGATRSLVYGKGWSNFVNAAFLFHEPLRLEAGEGLTLRYRIVVHDGMWSFDQADEAWRQWTHSP